MFNLIVRQTFLIINFIDYLRFEIVHFDTGAEGDYLAHVTFSARAKRVRKVT